MNNIDLITAINTFKEESPNLYNLAIEIINGIEIEDKIYSSEITDNQTKIYNYFRVRNSKIQAIGTERIREGGWYWFSED